MEFARELCWHRRRAVLAAGFAQNPPGNSLGQLLFHRPKRKTDAVPSQVAQAAIRLKRAVRPNVLGHEFFSAIKIECGRNPFHFPNHCRIVECRAHFLQATAVHKHNTVHELNSMMPAGIEHFTQIRHARGTRFFANDVLPRLRRPNHPFLPQSSRQRNINRVNVATS